MERRIFHERIRTGYGLTSYRQIVESYEHVSSMTYQEDGFFVQELKIGVKGG